MRIKNLQSEPGTRTSASLLRWRFSPVRPQKGTSPELFVPERHMLVGDSGLEPPTPSLSRRYCQFFQTSITSIITLNWRYLRQVGSGLIWSDVRTRRTPNLHQSAGVLGAPVLFEETFLAVFHNLQRWRAGNHGERRCYFPGQGDYRGRIEGLWANRHLVGLLDFKWESV